MKLSMSLIAKYLDPYQPECHILHDTMSIKGVRFLSAHHIQFSLEYIYFGAAEGYYQDSRYADALLLANGENQIICRGADYEELLNDVLSAFDFYAEFEQRLFLASTQHQPLEKMMSLMGSVLDCMLFIFDIGGYLLSGHGLEDIDGRPDLSNMIEQERLDFNGIGAVIVGDDGKIFHDLSDTPQYLSIKDAEEPGCVAMYLCQGEERVGFIMLFVRNTSQVPMCLCLAPILAQSCVNAAEFTDKSSLRQSKYSVFAALLNGEELMPAVMEKFENNVRVGSNVVLMAFQSISIRNYTFHKMLMNEIRFLDVPCIACEHEGRIIILAANAAVEDVIRLITSKIAVSSISLGISMPFQNLNNITVAYQQALFALNASSEPGIRYSKELALPYLIQTLQKNEMSVHLLHPALEILEKYDKENDTELFQTMVVYMQTGCNQTDTANMLYIHLNTLKYRVNRIRELTEVDFKNQEELFYIWLSLKVKG